MKWMGQKIVGSLTRHPIASKLKWVGEKITFSNGGIAHPETMPDPQMDCSDPWYLRPRPWLLVKDEPAEDAPGWLQVSHSMLNTLMASRVTTFPLAIMTIFSHSVGDPERIIEVYRSAETLSHWIHFQEDPK